MIDDFENVKKQLSELAEVLNSFKSEAVQLRIVELVLGGEHSEGDDDSRTPPTQQGRKRRKPRKKASPKSTDAGNNSKTKKNGPARSGSGAVATLTAVYEDGFFKTPQVIGDIVSHCEVNLARKIKASDISGKLGRMVRNGELKRSKNADGQYEYKNA